MASTKDNLKAAFAGESKANRMYLAFSKKAEKEGYPQIAKLFRAVADAETIHALTHFDVLKGAGSTADNLKQAIEGESYENTTMYPEFIAQAESDGDKAAVRSFTMANEVEKIHEKLYQSAANSVASNKDMPAKKLYICPVCGNVEEEEAPEKCAVCGAPGSSFREVL